MVQKCCAPGCSNASYNQSPEITFHRFPKDEYHRNMWIHNVKRKNWQPSQSSVLCSQHFEAKFLLTRKWRTILAPGAVPTLFEKNKLSEESNENSSKFRKFTQESLSEHRRTAKGLVLQDVQINILPVPEPELSTSTWRTPVASVPSASITSPIDTQIPMVLEPEVAPKSKPCTSTWEIPAASVPGSSITSSMHQKETRQSATVSKLKSRLLTKSKKIKSLQEQNRRMKKKVKQFSDIIADLRKKLNEEQLSILTNIPVKNKDFMIRYMKKAQGSLMEKSYPPEIRAFALQLNFYSPRAYNYVRQQFNTVLPHPVTLSRWYKKIDAQPGFTSESFKTLKSLSENSTYNIYVNLCVDEMAIKKEQVWDRTKSEFKGHVDTGTEVSDDSLPLATQALVLMVTAINACWKLPIAYFFIASMTGEQRANIVKMAIEMLYDLNIFARGLTFDGAASNISMATNLGCKFNLNNFAPYFFYKDLKIYAYYDPCHMLKLVRNCLGDFKILVDEDVNYIKFEYFSMLQDIAEKKGVHLGVKIRKAHIYFNKQKMKVRLAAQLLSKSVADALVFCKDVLKMDQFKDCSATVKFVKIINDCFDVLNSRSTLAPGHKKALCSANVDRTKEFVQNATKYISNLKFLNGNNVVNSSRKTGFVGFMLCLRNIMDLFNDLLNVGGIKYLCSYKMSQDHLEMFFGKMRSRGGFNDNPNVVQFQIAYKKNLICSELQLRERGILDLDNDSILSVSSTIALINNHTPSQDTNDSEVSNLEEKRLYSFLQKILTLSLDEYTGHVVTYIAGFICKRLIETVKCIICQQILIGNRDDFMFSLINIKDRGGLTYPSMGLVKIVKKCENFLKINNKNMTYNRFIVNFSIDRCNLDILSSESSDMEHDPQHLYLLLRLIVKLYLDIRCYHFAKTDQISNRNYFKKIILFQNK